MTPPLAEQPARVADHDVIWLEAECRSGPHEGRQWCEDDVWGTDCECDEGGHKPTKYIRMDLHEAEVERLHAAEARGMRRAATLVCDGCKEGWPMHPTKVWYHKHPTEDYTARCHAAAILAQTTGEMENDNG